jgi:hypothetical protein
MSNFGQQHPSPTKMHTQSQNWRSKILQIQFLQILLQILLQIQTPDALLKNAENYSNAVWPA